MSSILFYSIQWYRSAAALCFGSLCCIHFKMTASRDSAAAARFFSHISPCSQYWMKLVLIALAFWSHSRAMHWSGLAWESVLACYNCKHVHAIRMGEYWCSWSNGFLLFLLPIYFFFLFFFWSIGMFLLHINSKEKKKEERKNSFYSFLFSLLLVENKIL